MRFIKPLLFLIPFIYLLYGCAAAIVGGAAGATYVAIDNRTTGDIVEDQNIEVKFYSLYMEADNINDYSHVNITSYNRRVLLTGEAPTEELRQQIEALVHKIKNVRHIYNEIKLAAPSSAGSRTNDTYITSKVKTQLLASKDVKGMSVKVVTENGTVYLMGLVTEQQGNDISNIVRTIGGVERVVKLFEYVTPQNQKI